MKIALLQTLVAESRAENLKTARDSLRAAAAAGADMAVLPEMFNCPYSARYFAEYAEPEGGESFRKMAACAAEFNLCVVAGSMPERSEGKVYNTSYVFGRDGSRIARHRKAHLFDIDIPGGQYFRESDTFAPGGNVTTFAFGGTIFGLCICFDFRFPELSRLMALRGATVMVVPAAFNMTTGPLHWETMFRQRAVDDQAYTVGVAPARDVKSSYVSYANSIACSPMGEVLVRAGEGPCALYLDLDPEKVSAARRQLPLLGARRTDLYTLKENESGR